MMCFGRHWVRNIQYYEGGRVVIYLLLLYSILRATLTTTNTYVGYKELMW